MQVWAIGDLHLSFSVPEKDMAVFGPQWMNYAENIKENWQSFIKNEDLVLIPGDISWALRPEQAKIDLEWIGQLPGTKVIIKGNHDYWWTSLSKVKAILPPNIYAIQNDAFFWKGITIGGTRLWDSSEYNFDPYIDFRGDPKERQSNEEAEKIFKRELERLELSLKSMNPSGGYKIVMTHYPPISADLQPSKASTLLELYGVNQCVFGHLHNVKKTASLFGEKKGIGYSLVAADYINFAPKKIL